MAAQAGMSVYLRPHHELTLYDCILDVVVWSDQLFSSQPAHWITAVPRGMFSEAARFSLVALYLDNRGTAAELVDSLQQLRQSEVCSFKIIMT